MSVRIITDSTADLDRAALTQNSIETVPLYVHLGDKTFRDGVDIDAAALFRLCDKTRSSPKTSAVNVEDFMAAFQPILDAGDDIVCVTLSSALSSTYQNACTAAHQCPVGRVYPVDSMSVSIGTGILALVAARLTASGATAVDIQKALIKMCNHVHVNFVLDTLSYLHRGGRCSALKRFSATMLNLKPELAMQSGKLEPTARYRGNLRRAAKLFVDSTFAHAKKGHSDVLYIHHAMPEDEIAEMVQYAKRKGQFKRVVVTPVGTVIATHSGPGVFGMGFIDG